jgi:hypothetical protein
MVSALEDMPEPRYDETQRRLMPARVEIHTPDVAVKLERPGVAIGRHETECGRHLAAEPIDAKFNRELGTIGLDRILEQHVEELLGPIELQARIERRPFEVSQCLVIRGKRFVRRRDIRAYHAARERGIVLGNRDVVGEIDLAAAQRFAARARSI